MSELSRSLVDAAWAEMKDPPYTNWSYGELPTRAKAKVDRTVAAVLEKLAGEAHSFNDDLRLHKHQRDSLRRLAAQVREASR